MNNHWWCCYVEPVGVSPNEYCEPSLPKTVWVSTPYISRSLARHKYSLSASEGLLPLRQYRGSQIFADNNGSCLPHVLVTLEYLHLQLFGLNRNKSKLWHKGRRVEHRVIISQFGWKKIQINLGFNNKYGNHFFSGCRISRFLDNAHIEGRGQTTGQRSEEEQPDDRRGCLASVEGTFDTWAQKRFITHLILYQNWTHLQSK